MDGEWRGTEARIGPEACIEGSGRPLTGVLFAYLDVVMGSPPSGAINPTVDLQLRLFSPPRKGTVRFTARTLRLGRTLYVGEAELRHADDERPFALGVATFVNQPVPLLNDSDWEDLDAQGDALLATVYGRLSGTRRVRRGCLELDAGIMSDHPYRTVSGATLGRLIEQAAMDLFGGAAFVDELDVRFLNRVNVGPIRAIATLVGSREDAKTVRVEVVDHGDQDRLVTYGLAVCRTS